MRRAALIFCLVIGLAAAPVCRAETPAARDAKAKAAALEAGTGSEKPPGNPITAAEARAVDPAGTAAIEDPITCLARTIYWEAQGEGEEGMLAIASVVMNRVGHPGFPATVCAVVKEGQSQRRCQFAWWCDGRPDEAQDPQAYAQAREVARRALNRELPDPTGGALYFHRRGATPEWAASYTRTAAIGAHLFYTPPDGKAK